MAVENSNRYQADNARLRSTLREGAGIESPMNAAALTAD